ncbi:MAG: DUF1045 domain-containing protein [Hyphomicrobiaceae bacterium]|nr:DUF1045 domain-containing protein [Hyphomicrobiaceae bacterium]
MNPRYAIYYAPEAFGQFWELAAVWLGRDAATNEAPHASTWSTSLPPDLAARTVSASRYGFHATLKPPMHLAEGFDEAGLLRLAADFAAARAPFEIGMLKVANLSGFLALLPAEQREDLLAFAGDVVAAFEPARAPLSEDDRRRRLAVPLTSRQALYVERFGYPYVFEEFRFHMTLTDRLGDSERPKFANAAERFFAPVLAESQWLDRISVFREDEPGQPFVRIADHPLNSSAERKCAS